MSRDPIPPPGYLSLTNVLQRASEEWPSQRRPTTLRGETIQGGVNTFAGGITWVDSEYYEGLGYKRFDEVWNRIRRMLCDGHLEGFGLDRQGNVDPIPREIWRNSVMADANETGVISVNGVEVDVLIRADHWEDVRSGKKSEGANLASVIREARQKDPHLTQKVALEIVRDAGLTVSRQKIREMVKTLGGSRKPGPKGPRKN
jgi:hypothetical protein